MRIVFVGNNYLGWQVFKRLVDGKEDIIGLVLHPDEKSAYKSHILETARDTSCFVWDAPSLKNPVYLKKLKELEPDLILSVLFGYILKKNVLEIPKQGCINIHNGYLPYNKGVNANIWSIIDGTPAGGTIHFMDEGIDTGDIIARREVPVLFSDTGKTLYKKTEEACISLFEETWDSIKSGTMQRTPQDQKKGTFHAKAHLSNLDRIFPDNMYKGQELVDIIRARTYSPFSSAYCEYENEKYFLELSIETDEDRLPCKVSTENIEIVGFKSLNALSNAGVEDVLSIDYENDLMISKEKVVCYQKSLVETLLSKKNRAEGYVALVGGKCKGMIVVNFSDWDSKILGYSFGNISSFKVLPSADPVIGMQLLNCAISKAKEWDIECLSSRISYKHAMLIHLLEEHGFQLMDVSITWGVPTKDIHDSGSDLNGGIIRSANMKDLSTLKQIARSNFRFSHFHMDPKFPKDRANNLFACWVENAIKGISSNVLVLETNNEIAGFVTLNINQYSEKTIGFGLGEIDLLAVASNHQGKGWGSKLVSSGLHWLKHKVHFVEIRTQLMNSFAINTFKRNQLNLLGGGQSLPSGATFHGWIKNK